MVKICKTCKNGFDNIPFGSHYDPKKCASCVYIYESGDLSNWEPVDEEVTEDTGCEAIIEYCKNDVRAIEAVFNARQEEVTEDPENTDDQKAKADAGKPKLTLVPTRIIYDIAEVREYGNNKYPDGGPDNWKRVEAQRYRDAAFRHFLAYIKDPESIDPESGIKHRKHLECNLAFLAEMEDGE